MGFYVEALQYLNEQLFGAVFMKTQFRMPVEIMAYLNQIMQVIIHINSLLLALNTKQCHIIF